MLRVKDFPFFCFPFFLARECFHSFRLPLFRFHFFRFLFSVSFLSYTLYFGGSFNFRASEKVACSLKIILLLIIIISSAHPASNVRNQMLCCHRESSTVNPLRFSRRWTCLAVGLAWTPTLSSSGPPTSHHDDISPSHLYLRLMSDVTLH